MVIRVNIEVHLDMRTVLRIVAFLVGFFGS